jgi:hypothetical protein
LIIGAALSEIGTNPKPVLALIPVEALIFGLWFLDHSVTIVNIGRHLAEAEARINNIVVPHPPDLPALAPLRWEMGCRDQTMPRNAHLFGASVFATFVLPAFFCWTLVALRVVLVWDWSRLWLQDHCPRTSWIPDIDGIIGSQLVTEVHVEYVVAALVLLILGAALAYVFFRMRAARNAAMRIRATQDATLRRGVC